ncbi:MAG: hypothetical protein ACLR7Z_17645 [Bilophila wadsworthia]
MQRTAAASGDDMAAVREALHASAAGGGHVGVGHLEDAAHAAAQSRTFMIRGNACLRNGKSGSSSPQ